MGNTPLALISSKQGKSDPSIALRRFKQKHLEVPGAWLQRSNLFWSVIAQGLTDAIQLLCA